MTNQNLVKIKNTKSILTFKKIKTNIVDKLNTLIKLALNFIIITFTVFSNFAQASYQITPMGYTEGLLGNNGIALEASVGANIYNPAGIADLERNNFSASSSILSITNIKFAGSEFEDRSPPPSFRSTSAYLMNQLKISDVYLSFYFSNELDFQFSKYLSYNFSDRIGAFNLEATINESKLGFTYAKKLNSALAIAISPVLYIRNSKSLNLSKQESSGNTSTSSSLENANLTAYSARFGCLNSNEKFNFGFYWEPEGRSLNSQRSEDKYYLDTGGSFIDSSNGDTYNYRPQQKYGFGFKINLKNSQFLVIDLDRTEVTYSPGTKEIESNSMKSVGVGYSVPFDENIKVMTGFKHNEIHDNTSDNKISLATYTNVGISQKIKFLTNLINLYHSELKSLGSDSSSGSIIENTGLSFATSYNY